MNNLHRELAPIADAAWVEIEQEASRTLKRYLAARHVVDVDVRGLKLSGIGTGHVREIAAPAEGVSAAQREMRPVVELRVPFALSRRQIDDVERGSADSDWQPLKDAARKIAFAEDAAVFDGYAAAGIAGIRQASSHAPVKLPAALADYPVAVAAALNALKLAGVNGPYRLVLSADLCTALSGGSDGGYPILRHVEQLLDGEVVWAPAIAGGVLLSTRGGDFELAVGQDFSIGYLGHDAGQVQLYLQEGFTFRMLTAEAAVALAAA